jgi:hypothetical protein
MTELERVFRTDQLLPRDWPAAAANELAMNAADITTAVRALRRAPRMIVAQARAPPGVPKAPSRASKDSTISRASGLIITEIFWTSSRGASTSSRRRQMATSRSTETDAVKGNGAAPPAEPQQVKSAESGAFNPDDYRYTLASTGPGVRRQLSIPEGRPKKGFFRLDTRPEYRQEVAVYGHKEGFDAEDYLVAPQVQEVLGERYVKRAVIRVCIVRPNTLRLWAIRYPDDEGRPIHGIRQLGRLPKRPKTNGSGSK